MRRFTRERVINRETLGIPQVVFTGHVLERMKQRNISEADIYRAVEHPDAAGLPTQPGRQRVRWNKGERTGIDVVYEISGGVLRIITTFKTDRTIPANVPPTIVRVNRSDRRKPKQRKPQRRGKKR